MNVSVLLNCHDNLDLIQDTIDSIAHYVTKNIVVLIDGASWGKFQNISLPVTKMEGFYHNAAKSPYRNMALGMKMLRESYPNSDWYCYSEPDVLFASSRILKNLQMASERNIWMMGNDGHVDDIQMPLVESLIGSKFKSQYYLLGCCQFFHKNFLNKLDEINFFDRFLNLTNAFSAGYFPLYKGYDISEHMYPTLCRHFGGDVGVLAHYDEYGVWHGAYEYFPMRWKPELDPEKEKFPEASILHPVKDVNNPIRLICKEKRQNDKRNG
jgi:hypothetical protein